MWYINCGNCNERKRKKIEPKVSITPAKSTYKYCLYHYTVHFVESFN